MIGDLATGSFAISDLGPVLVFGAPISDPAEIAGEGSVTSVAAFALLSAGLASVEAEAAALIEAAGVLFSQGAVVALNAPIIVSAEGALESGEISLAIEIEPWITAAAGLDVDAAALAAEARSFIGIDATVSAGAAAVDGSGAAYIAAAGDIVSIAATMDGIAVLPGDNATFANLESGPATVAGLVRVFNHAAAELLSQAAVVDGSILPLISASGELIASYSSEYEIQPVTGSFPTGAAFETETVNTPRPLFGGVVVHDTLPVIPTIFS